MVECPSGTPLVDIISSPRLITGPPCDYCTIAKAYSL